MASEKLPCRPSDAFRAQAEIPRPVESTKNLKCSSPEPLREKHRFETFSKRNCEVLEKGPEGQVRETRGEKRARTTGLHTYDFP